MPIDPFLYGWQEEWQCELGERWENSSLVLLAPIRGERLEELLVSLTLDYASKDKGKSFG